MNRTGPHRQRPPSSALDGATRPTPRRGGSGEGVDGLAETARSVGYEFQAKQFERAGYTVTFPWPPQGTRERGVMIVSRLAR